MSFDNQLVTIKIEYRMDDIRDKSQIWDDDDEALKDFIDGAVKDQIYESVRHHVTDVINNILTERLATYRKQVSEIADKILEQCDDQRRS